MTNFQPGDTVIVINEGTARLGQVGVVTEIRDDHILPVSVRFADGELLGYRPPELAAS